MAAQRAGRHRRGHDEEEGEHTAPYSGTHTLAEGRASEARMPVAAELLEDKSAAR